MAAFGGGTLRAARRYAVMQPVIVDKEPLFERLFRLVAGVWPDGPGRVVELGMGTGGCLESVVRRGLWPGAELIGCDLSAERVAVAGESLAASGREVRLCAGVNALDAGQAFYREVVPAASVDVVILSQFEHYAPNHGASVLAGRLAGMGRRFSTKAELRRLAASRLRPGGWLMVIDDYEAATADEQAAWHRAWDGRVVDELARPEVGARLAAVDAEWTSRVVRRYGAGRPRDERLALAARARRRRRWRDLEETEPLVSAADDFCALFGGGACGVVRHPEPSLFPQFHLLWGRVGPG